MTEPVERRDLTGEPIPEQPLGPPVPTEAQRAALAALIDAIKVSTEPADRGALLHQAMMRLIDVRNEALAEALVMLPGHSAVTALARRAGVPISVVMDAAKRIRFTGPDL